MALILGRGSVIAVTFVASNNIFRLADLVGLGEDAAVIPTAPPANEASRRPSSSISSEEPAVFRRELAARREMSEAPSEG